MPNDAVRAVAELAASQHRAFTRRQAADLNFDRSRVANAKRQGWLTEPYPGVLVVAGGEESWHHRLITATLADGGHAVASHRAAARLHQLDGFEECNLVEVSVNRGHRWRRGNDVVAHHVAALEPPDRVAIEGIQCTGLARTLADLGAVVEPMLVRRALTDARRRGTSLRWIQLTADRLHRPGPSGAGVLLRQLARIPFEGRVPDTWFEELLALCLEDPEIPPFELSTRSVTRATDSSPGPTSASRRCGSGSRVIAAGSISARSPSLSTSNAIWRPAPAVGSSTTSGGSRRGVRPRCWPS